MHQPKPTFDEIIGHYGTDLRKDAEAIMLEYFDGDQEELRQWLVTAFKGNVFKNRPPHIALRDEDVEDVHRYIKKYYGK